jgi:hypothetical protein
MSELERLLVEASESIGWPPTPRLAPPAGVRRRGRRRSLLLAIAAAAAVALGVALAVPGARSAILRALDLEGETVERVAVLPPAQERPLGVGLGPGVTAATAARALGHPALLPTLDGAPVLHLQGGVVSLLLDGPVLVSEFDDAGEPALIKKVIGGATHVRGVQVGKATGFWISGSAHLYIAPDVPSRLAGNVLVWNWDGLLLRIEGRGLTESDALHLAAELDGT